MGINAIKQLVRFGLRSGSVLLVLLSVVNVPITLVNGVLTARALGPADRGDYAAIVAFCSILTLVATAGVSEIIILNINSRDAFARTFLFTWLHSLALAVLFFIPAVLYATNLGYGDGLIIYLVATTPLVGVLATQAVVQLIAVGEVPFAAVARVIPTASQLCLTVILLSLDRATLANVLLAYWSAIAIAAAFSLRQVLRLAPGLMPFGANHVRSFYGQLKDLSGSQILRSISSRADVVLVAWMLTSVDAGLYSVALSPVLAGTSIISSLSPLVLKGAHEGRGQVGSVSIVLSLVVAVGLIVVATPLVTVLYGRAYADAAALMPYLALGLVANVAFDVSLRLTQAHGGARIGLVSTVLAVAVQVGGITILGEMDGIRGVAIANATGFISGMLVLAKYGVPSLFSALSPITGARLIGDTLRKHVGAG